MIRLAKSRHGYAVKIGGIEVDITAYQMAMLIGAFAHQIGVIDSKIIPSQCGTRCSVTGGAHITMQSYPGILYIACIYENPERNDYGPKIQVEALLADDIREFWQVISKALANGVEA